MTLTRQQRRAQERRQAKVEDSQRRQAEYEAKAAGLGYQPMINPRAMVMTEEPAMASVIEAAAAAFGEKVKAG